MFLTMRVCEDDVYRVSDGHSLGLGLDELVRDTSLARSSSGLKCIGRGLCTTLDSFLNKAHIALTCSCSVSVGKQPYQNAALCTHLSPLVCFVLPSAASYAPPTNMLLTGICTAHPHLSAPASHSPDLIFEGQRILSLTTYPITPMIRKPMPTAWLMRKNSRRSARYHMLVSALCRLYLCRAGGVLVDVRLLHLVMNCRPSLRNSRGISRSSFAWSMVGDEVLIDRWRCVVSLDGSEVLVDVLCRSRPGRIWGCGGQLAEGRCLCRCLRPTHDMRWTSFSFSSLPRLFLKLRTTRPSS